jgi:hypothetical protein
MNGNLNRKRAGFSLIEIVICVVFIGLTFLSIFQMNSQSNKSAMDAYYEFMAVQFAREPLEFCRALGYKRLRRLLTQDSPQTRPEFAFLFPGEGNPDPARIGKDYPLEISLFQRKIEYEWSPDGLKPPTCQVRVTVFPREGGKLKAWLTRNNITLSLLIVEEPR